MPWVGFEPTIPVFERAKTVHALDRAATVIGRGNIYTRQKWKTKYEITLEPIVDANIRLRAELKNKVKLWYKQWPVELNIIANSLWNCEFCARET
jgi:hypothetical protein